MKFKGQLDDTEKEIEVVRQGDRLQISYDGRTTEARIVYTDGPHFVLEVEEPSLTGDKVRRKQIRAVGIQDGDKRQLWANGRLVNYERLREGSAAHETGPEATLSASIPAVVSEVLVAVGDIVKAGEKLILLESMKMVLPIQAPYDGQVTAIHCQAGEAVQPGLQLIELESE
ncbi:MAG: biotin/lipoyl-containing protein [Candidatus Promineifilaceae bacterium]